MKLLILGGAGFVGSNLANYFKDNNKVTIFDNLVRRGTENNLLEFKQNNIEFIHGDIRNQEDFNKLQSNYDVILLCAAQPSAVNYSNPTFDIQNNTVGVLNTLEFARKVGAGIIFWSTNKCYSGTVCNNVQYEETLTRYRIVGEKTFDENTDVNGPDHSIYGVSKIMADLLIQEWSDAYKIPAIINRFSCLAGPRQWGLAEQGWVAWFAVANELGLPIEIFGFKGKQVRDCLFADDLCKLIQKQIYSLSSHYGSVFNVGGGPANTISLLEAIHYLEAVNKKFSNIVFHEKPRRADQRVYISNIDKVKKEFDWKPRITIHDGYEEILDWVKTNRKTLERMYL